MSTPSFVFFFFFSVFLLFFFFFFFQAEDGIRDLYVTGVQTCALPIWRGRAQSTDRLATNLPALDLEDMSEPSADLLFERARAVEGAAMAVPGVTNRSEERRVGKEWRTWGGRYQEKEKIEEQ